MAAKAPTVEIPQLIIGNIKVVVEGTSRLVTHRFAHKTILQLLGNHMHVPELGKRKAKDPVEDFFQSLYLMGGTKPIVHGDFSTKMLNEILLNAASETASGEGGTFESIWAEGRFGFPAVGVKAAIVRAGTDVGLNMTDLRRQILIPAELLEIECAPGPRMRCDVTRTESGTPDIRFRPEFLKWTMQIPIQYNKTSRTRDQIVNLVRMAGFGVGLGEWRPSGKKTSGTWGTFKIVSVQEFLDDIG